MRISRKSKGKVKELARRFVEHSPPLCRNHTPDGLPIDAPEGVDDISENHASYKFEKIVEEESRGKSGEDAVVKARIRTQLREIFAREFYDTGDMRSCIECYEDRKEKEDVPIRMELPDDWSLEH